VAKGNIAMSMMEKWAVEEDARTLMEAAAIRKDAKRLKKALAYTDTKIKEYQSLRMEEDEEDSEMEMD
jgi:uncharacterized lipoprotein YehR (DUF1307 family)